VRFLNPILVVFIMFLLAFVGGCGGDKSPTAPPAPAYANIAGHWTGTGGATSIIPVNHPLVQMLLPSVGVKSPATLSIQQDGQNITARFTWTESGAYTDYSGTVGKTSFTLTGYYSSIAAMTEIECPDGVLRDMYIVSDSISGTISGNAINATGADTWNCKISGTGAADGVIMFSGACSFTKGK